MNGIISSVYIYTNLNAYFPRFFSLYNEYFVKSVRELICYGQRNDMAPTLFDIDDGMAGMAWLWKVTITEKLFAEDF